MLIIKKKHIFHELAVSMYLMLHFNPDTIPFSLTKRIRERASDALQAAAQYTGEIGDKDVETFLKTKHLTFSIACGRDIIKGDTIRFIETVFNNKVKPARPLGRRGVIAEVTSVHNPAGSNPILYMRVISSRGTWELNPAIPIRREMRNVVHTEVMRAPWDNEAKRQEIKAALALGRN